MRISSDYLYPQADVLAHARYCTLQSEVGAPALAEARAHEPALAEVSLRMPDITFEDGEVGLRLGGKSLRLIHAPGHTADSLMIYLEEDHILFAADTVLPVPSIADGDIDAQDIGAGGGNSSARTRRDHPAR